MVAPLYVGVGGANRPPRLHENIRRLREAAGITGRDAAASVGIHQADWSDLETGKNPNPTVATLKKIAAALGVTLAELFLDEDGESVTLE